MKKQSTRRRIDAPTKGVPRPAALEQPLRDRIKELRRVRAADLAPHPLNWRSHPPEQRAVLAALLREVGFANALLARELPDGRLQLIDGHLRAETAPEMEVPVLVLDVDEREAEKLLATLDPLGTLAAADAQAVNALRERLQVQEAEVAQFLDDVQSAAVQRSRDLQSSIASTTDPPLALPSLFQLLIECPDEPTQQALFEQLTGQGHRCRVLVL